MLVSNLLAAADGLVHVIHTRQWAAHCLLATLIAFSSSPVSEVSTPGVTVVQSTPIPRMLPIAVAAAQARPRASESIVESTPANDVTRRTVATHPWQSNTRRRPLEVQHQPYTNPSQAGAGDNKISMQFCKPQNGSKPERNPSTEQGRLDHHVRAWFVPTRTPIEERLLSTYSSSTRLCFCYMVYSN